jgi:hypothetical protein
MKVVAVTTCGAPGRTVSVLGFTQGKWRNQAAWPVWIIGGIDGTP